MRLDLQLAIAVLVVILDRDAHLGFAFLLLATRICASFASSGKHWNFALKDSRVLKRYFSIKQLSWTVSSQSSSCVKPILLGSSRLALYSWQLFWTRAKTLGVFFRIFCSSATSTSLALQKSVQSKHTAPFNSASGGQAKLHSHKPQLYFPFLRPLEAMWDGGLALEKAGRPRWGHNGYGRRDVDERGPTSKMQRQVTRNGSRHKNTRKRHMCQGPRHTTGHNGIIIIN